MRKAHQLMIHGKSTEFYDEILHALWGYIGDKLNIPVEQLSRNNINEVFTNRDIDKDTVNKFIETLDECEFQRYAPGDENGNMKVTYDKSILAISEVESVIDDNKRNIKTSKMMSSVFILIFGGLLWVMRHCLKIKYKRIRHIREVIMNMRLRLIRLLFLKKLPLIVIII